MTVNGRFQPRLIFLKQLLRGVRVVNLGEARILACSSKFDFCVRVAVKDLQRMRRCVQQILREPLSNEAAFVIDRVVKLHGRHSYDIQLGEKVKQLSWLFGEFQKSKRSNCDSLMTSVNESILDILPLSQSTSGSQLFHRKMTFSQEIEAELHNGQMDSVLNRIELDTKLFSSGITLKNLSNIPGHEILEARNGAHDHNLTRRLLRKLVVKCTCDQYHETQAVIRRYLKMISPLDDAIATASGHALKGDIEQIHKLLKDEESVFVDKPPAFKVCFDLFVTLELFENNFTSLAFSFLDGQCMRHGSNKRLFVDGISAVIIDSVLTYCIVNKLDDLASKIMNVYCISPWQNSMLHPTVMAARRDFPNHNWNLFSSTFRLPVTVPKVPILPTEPEKNSNVQIVKALSV